ncbi:hypothetical protein [Kitasatospora sp. NPDC057541]|uniref:hypothetical protein n=1 Tax=unclassified Kitasatospora TaxID=2633591 RepID=UPI0036C9BA0D
MGDLFAPPGEPGPPEVRTRARRTVAARARDTEDCRLLLDALGLLEPGDPPGTAGTAGP